MNNTHDMKLSNYNRIYYKSNQSSHKEEVRQKFVLDCVNNNDILLFEKLIALELKKIKNNNNIKEYNNIDSLFNELILYSDYNVWKEFLEKNTNYKSFLRYSLNTAFIFNCQPFVYNDCFEKSSNYFKNIKKFSFIQLLSYIQEPYTTNSSRKKFNKPDFSFPFDLNFNINIDIETIIKLEKEKFGKGYSILYLMNEWKPIIDNYFEDDLIFKDYLKNNGEKNLLALNIGKF